MELEPFGEAATAEEWSAQKDSLLEGVLSLDRVVFTDEMRSFLGLRSSVEHLVSLVTQPPASASAVVEISSFPFEGDAGFLWKWKGVSEMDLTSRFSHGSDGIDLKDPQIENKMNKSYKVISLLCGLIEPSDGAPAMMGQSYHATQMIKEEPSQACVNYIRDLGPVLFALLFEAFQPDSQASLFHVCKLMDVLLRYNAEGLLKSFMDNSDAFKHAFEAMMNYCDRACVSEVILSIFCPVGTTMAHNQRGFYLMSDETKERYFKMLSKIDVLLSIAKHIWVPTQNETELQKHKASAAELLQYLVQRLAGMEGASLILDSLVKSPELLHGVITVACGNERLLNDPEAAAARDAQIQAEQKAKRQANNPHQRHSNARKKKGKKGKKGKGRGKGKAKPKGKPKKKKPNPANVSKPANGGTGEGNRENTTGDEACDQELKDVENDEEEDRSIDEEDDDDDDDNDEQEKGETQKDDETPAVEEHTAQRDSALQVLLAIVELTTKKKVPSSRVKEYRSFAETQNDYVACQLQPISERIHYHLDKNFDELLRAFMDPHSFRSKALGSNVPHSSYVVKRPFSNYRLELIKLIVTCIKHKPMALLDKLTRGNWVSLTSWFMEYRHCNLYHVVFVDLFFALLRTKNSKHPSLLLVLGELRLLETMITHYKDPEMMRKSSLSGPILKICNCIRLQAATLPPEHPLVLHLDSNQIWVDFLPILISDTFNLVRPWKASDPALFVSADFQYQKQKQTQIQKLTAPPVSTENMINLGSDFAKSLGFDL